jgi:hypothetical protein
VEKALTDLRKAATAAKISRNGQVAHDGYEYLHAPVMYDLVNWPGKKSFVAATVAGITLGGLFVVPGIMYWSNIPGMKKKD